MKEVAPLEFRWKDSSLEVDLNDRFSMKIGSQTKSQILKTSSLQKGLILSCGGRELGDEGMGFGVPVIKYRDEMYFSKDAKIIQMTSKNAVKKSFRINGLERMRIGKLGEIAFPSPALRFLAHAYRSSNFLGKKMTEVDQALRQRADIKTDFVEAGDRGEVSVTYEVHPRMIHVRCDLTGLEKDALQRIFVLNEQGSHFFRQYSDTDGMRLEGRNIGAWMRVKAERACFSDAESTFSFCLNGLEGITLWRGREEHADLSWSGLIYGSSPNIDIIDYDIFLKY